MCIKMLYCFYSFDACPLTELMVKLNLAPYNLNSDQLVGWLTGSTALHLESLTDAEILQKVVSTLEKFIKQSLPKAKRLIRFGTYPNYQCGIEATSPTCTYILTQICYVTLFSQSV